jgi:hypothetical protein
MKVDFDGAKEILFLKSKSFVGVEPNETECKYPDSSIKPTFGETFF